MGAWGAIVPVNRTKTYESVNGMKQKEESITGYFEEPLGCETGGDFVHTTNITGLHEITKKEKDLFSKKNPKIYHGIQVADNYQVLEQSHDPEVKQWIEQQNVATDVFLKNTNSYQMIKNRLKQLWTFSYHTVPVCYGDYYFYWKNLGETNQDILIRTKTIGTNEEIVFDPNILSPQGLIAVSSYAISNNGRYLAYALSKNGGIWQTLKIRDIHTGKDFDEELDHCNYTVIAWNAQGTGFYYNCFPEKDYQASSIYFHALGTSQQDDTFVFQHEHNHFLCHPMISSCGNYLLVSVQDGYEPTHGLYIRKVNEDGDFITMFDHHDARFDYLGNSGDTFYFLTNGATSRGRVIAVDMHNPSEQHWQEIISEQECTFEQAHLVGNRYLVGTHVNHTHHEVCIYDIQKKSQEEIVLPTDGTVSQISYDGNNDCLYINISSTLHPHAVVRWDLKIKKLSTVFSSGYQDKDINFAFSAYESIQRFCTSQDGTSIPIFITHKKGVSFDGNAPTIMYGYGAFGINRLPVFNPYVLHWLEQGGVYARANIRGGGVYGREWHNAAKHHERPKSFADFIAACEWLIENNITSPLKLATNGLSMGGFLLLSCMLQRPDLFGAVIAEVPIADLLRLPRFDLGYQIIPEVGDPLRSVEEFSYLKDQSPLLNIDPTQKYPPLFVTTADHDGIVHPMHGRKFVAAMQEARTNNIVLLREEKNVGHGDGKPRNKRLESATDLIAFLHGIFALEYKGVKQC